MALTQGGPKGIPDFADTYPVTSCYLVNIVNNPNGPSTLVLTFLCYKGAEQIFTELLSTNRRGQCRMPCGVAVWHSKEVATVCSYFNSSSPTF